MTKKIIAGRPTYEQVSAEIEYDPCSGNIRRLRPTGRARSGWYPGNMSSDNSCYSVTILKRTRTVADTAWLLMTKEWSHTLVRHRDGDSLNNRWNNLTNLKAADYSDLTFERANECLEYDPLTGLFRWKNRPWLNPDWFPGNYQVKDDRYEHFTIQIDARQYPASRVAYLLMEGCWPIHEIDHKDRNSLNNIYKNLRPATHTYNMFNKGVRCDNKLGIKGVRQKRNGRYEARITIDKRDRGLGTYDTIGEASRRYDEIAKEIHGEFFYKDEDQING